MMVATQAERGSASSHYELLARLATGGMAEIFLARAHSLAGFERYVVLKRIRPERGDDARWINMFLDEARLAAQLQHPNIAQVFDLGRIGEDYFFTMEYVHGADVLDILTRTAEHDQHVPLHVALAIVAGAAAGLAHAHDRCGASGKPLGIVHRDISPSNLMVTVEGAVKVVDFGVAKARSRSLHTPQAGMIMGKVAYLSPEQCKTADVDRRSDLFSLGVVLYELLTHVRPFKRDSDAETLAAITRHTPTRPSLLVDGLPRRIDNVVMRALAKDPDARFQTAREMIDAIEDVAERESASLSPGVLARFMREQFGELPEPWRAPPRDPTEHTLKTFTGELITDPGTRTLAAFPFNATAADVPLLPKTSMIDLTRLFPPGQTSTVPPPSPRAVPPPIPVRAVTAPATVVDPPPRPPIPTAVATARSGPTMIVTPYVRRRSWPIVGATAVAVMAVALVLYSLLGGGRASTAGPPTSHVDAPIVLKPTPRPAVVPAVAPPAAPPPELPPPTLTVPPPPAPTLPAAIAPAAARPEPGEAPRGSDDAPRPLAKKKPTTSCTDPLDCQY
ncbi:MAG TPA: serine/threonine-protein kinase [Kofleriaceae bacterium]|nr:serine/threonine-protein kinase [Kofleriaceae bacterium]